MLFFIVHLSHDEVKIIKFHTLEYLTPAQYDNTSDHDKTNQESEIANISATNSGTRLKYNQPSLHTAK